MLLLARLRFAHAWLWKRDETYRLAAVLGPPVLLGLALAGGVTHELAAIRAGTAPGWLEQGWAKGAAGLQAAFGFGGRWAGGASAPWATPLPPIGLPSDGTPTAIAPAVPMPPDGPASVVARLGTGWTGMVLPVTGTDDYDIGFGIHSEGAIALRRPALDMAALLAAAPAQGRHLIGAEGVVMIRTGGRYSMSLQLDRKAGAPVATCLSRLTIGTQTAIGDARLGTGGGSTTHRPVALDLKAGFYRVSLLFGCWRDGRNDPSGTLSLVLAGPGDAALAPLKAGDLFHTLAN